MIELIEKIARARHGDDSHGDDGPVDDGVTLPYALRQKSRQRVRLDSGREAALVLAPGTPLDHGDRLRAADGTVVQVRSALEAVSTGRTDDPLRLARACYHLGNRHVALQVGAGWVRYQPDHVLDDMLRGLGLTVTAKSAAFEPERGAYHEQTLAHRHHNGEAPSPPHSHAHAHGHHH